MPSYAVTVQSSTIQEIYHSTGDDPGSLAKPDPGNALALCRQLNCSPAATVMVGDTPADTRMGQVDWDRLNKQALLIGVQAAGLGLTVGVLTGVGGRDDLQEADLVLNSVTEVVDLLAGRPLDNLQVLHHSYEQILSKSLFAFLLNPSQCTFLGQWP